MRVYVAGPISLGDLYANLRSAIDAADQLLESGHAPFVPHLACVWNMIHPHGYEQWMALDREWLLQCNALLRLPGESAGADREVQTARLHDIPSFESVEAVLEATVS